MYNVYTNNELENLIREFIGLNSDNPCYYDGNFYDTDEDSSFDFDGWLAPTGYDLVTGATKICLIPQTKSRNPKSDYVLKIPYKGSVIGESETVCENGCKAHAAWDNQWDVLRVANMRMVVSNMINPCIGCKNHQEEYTFDYGEFNGVRLAGSRDNYCEREAIITALAFLHGVEDVFLPTYYLGTFYGVPVYIQKRAEVGDFSYASKESEIIYKSHIEPMFTESHEIGCAVGGKLVESWGEEKTARVIDFIIKYDINDLHGGNRASYNGKQVFIDYAGYRR